MSKRQRVSAEDRLAEINAQMEHWTSFIRALDVPGDLVPAFASGRVELVRLAQPRPISEAECRVLYDLIGGLLETNRVLRDHAQAVADYAQVIAGNVKGVLTTAERLQRLAEFAEPDLDEDQLDPLDAKEVR
jgi:hypothetical protein